MADNLKRLAAMFDVALNPKGEKDFGFTIFIFPIKPNVVGKIKTQYVSNISNRRMIAVILRDALERLEK